MYKGYAIHVVVPAYNEQDFIADVIRTMPALVDRIFVVDDCGSDQTSARAAAVGDPRVSVHRTPRNLGVGGATGACEDGAGAGCCWLCSM